MDTTDRLDLILPANGDYTGRWEVPVNANMTAIDDEFKAIALAVSGSETGDYSALNTNYLDDLVRARSSQLGANAIASVSARINYDTERDLVRDPSMYSTYRAPTSRGGFYDSQTTSNTPDSWSTGAAANPISAEYDGVNNCRIAYDGSSGDPIYVMLNGNRYCINRSIKCYLGLDDSSVARTYVLYFSTRRVASGGGLDFVMDLQTSRDSGGGLLSATIGASQCTAAGIGAADVGLSNWQPKSGDILEITDALDGNIYRYMVNAVVGANTISIIGTFPKTFTNCTYVVRDYRQCNIYAIKLGDALSFYNFYTKIVDIATHIFVNGAGYVGTSLAYATFAAAAGGADFLQISKGNKAYGRNKMVYAYANSAPTAWAHGTVFQSIDLASIGLATLPKNITFFAIASSGEVILFDPCCATAAAVYAPIFNASMLVDSPPGASVLWLGILRNQDYQSAGGTFARYYAPGPGVTTLSYADLAYWGLILDFGD